LAYALSPIDLIPDFIPVIGLLDDLLLLPLGICLAIRFIPKSVWLACKLEAEANPIKLPQNKWAGLAIFLIWLALLLIISLYGYNYFINV
jgi:hypothetical protein